MLTRPLHELPNNAYRIKVNTAALKAETTKKSLWKIEGPSYCKDFRAADKLTTLQTVIERYSKLTKKTKADPAILGCAMYDAVVQKAFKEDKQRPIEWRHILQASHELCESIQDKGTAKTVGAFFENEREFHNVDFFMKQIIKFKKSDVRPTESLKAGQGIASHKKEMNVYFGIAVRALELSLKEQLKDNFIFANGQPEYNYGVDFAARFDPYDEYLEGDGVEFDASQGPTTHDYEKRFFREAGFSDEVIEFWFAHKKGRIFTCRGVFQAFVMDKKDSGYADTLFGNTLWTLGCFCYVVEYDRLTVFFGKGDDNGASGRKLRINADKLQQLTEIGCLWKFDFTRCLSFCNYFYTRLGALPDIVQRMTKLLSRKFINFEEVCEYHTSMKDQVKLINTQGKLDMCIAALSDYYNISHVDAKLITHGFINLITDGPQRLFSLMRLKEYVIEY